MNRDEIINKLFDKQIPNIESKKRLNVKDIIRFVSYIKSDPFSLTRCCEWHGSISKSSHQSKYINFWFNKKKQALHRILYANYKGNLPKNKYLKFSCVDPNMHGICCNINHIEIINNQSDQTKQLNQLDQLVQSDQTNQPIGKTSKAKKSKNNNNLNPDINPIINTTNNTYDKDIFIIIFDD